MKTLLALFLFSLTTLSFAEICTSVIRDNYGYEFETFTRSSYSEQAACDLATYDCREALSYGQSVGRYYNAFCAIKDDRRNPYPPSQSLVCQTDLVDSYGRLVRSFTAFGTNEYDACNSSDDVCKRELARDSSYGYRCINRGIIDNRYPRPPRPPERTRTEQCSANRLDPAGMFIQRYTRVATGPTNTDVRGEACRSAMNDCFRDLRGRQTCNIFN